MRMESDCEINHTHNHLVRCIIAFVSRVLEIIKLGMSIDDHDVPWTDITVNPALFVQKTQV